MEHPKKVNPLGNFLFTLKDIFAMYPEIVIYFKKLSFLLFPICTIPLLLVDYQRMTQPTVHLEKVDSEINRKVQAAGLAPSGNYMSKKGILVKLSTDVNFNNFHKHFVTSTSLLSFYVFQVRHPRIHLK